MRTVLRLALILAQCLATSAGCGRESTAIDRTAPSSALEAARADQATSSTYDGLQVGGSNYVAFDITGVEPGAGLDGTDVRIVLGYYGDEAATIDGQLRTMRQGRQEKISLMIWHLHDATLDEVGATTTNTLGLPDSRFIYGMCLLSNGGALHATHRDNLRQVVEKIASLGFSELVVRLAPVGDSGPGGWLEWDEVLFQESWNYLVDVRRTVTAATKASAMRVLFDLGAEQGGQTSGQHPLYNRRMWANYVYSFGKADTYGFSVSWYGERLGTMLSNLEYGGGPDLYAVDIYPDAAGAVREMAAQLASAGKLGNPIIVQETFYNDTATFRAFYETAAAAGVRLQSIYQWPLSVEAAAEGYHFSEHFPASYQRYGEPQFHSGGSAGGDKLWILGDNIGADAYVDVRHPVTWELLDSYRSVAITRYPNLQFDKEQITLTLASSYERTLLATTGLRVFIVNPGLATWSGGDLVR